jgi:hypothetical protein
MPGQPHELGLAGYFPDSLPFSAPMNNLLTVATYFDRFIKDNSIQTAIELHRNDSAAK